MYADAARMTPTSMSSQSLSMACLVILELVFCIIDMSRVSEDHIRDTILMMICKIIKVSRAGPRFVQQ